MSTQTQIESTQGFDAALRGDVSQNCQRHQASKIAEKLIDATTG